MAKLPCPPQSRIYTLKDTGETMSYDQVREYLMSNPELWSGKGEQKAGPLSSVEATAKALQEFKTPTLIDKIAKFIGGSKFINSKRRTAKGDAEILRQQDIDQTVNKKPTSRIKIKGDEVIFKDGDSLYEKLITEGFTEKEAYGIIDAVQDIFPDESREFYPDEFKEENVEDISSVIKEERFKRYINEELNKEAYRRKIEEARKYINRLKEGEFVFTKKSIGFVKNVLDEFEKGNVFVFTDSQLNDLGVSKKQSKEIVDSFDISEAYHAAKKDGTNPELVKAVEDLLGEKAEGKQAAANTPEGIAARIRNKKQRGALSTIDFGTSVAIYNGALEFMAAQVEKGTKLGEAIANTIKWIDERMKGEKWNKEAFEKAFRGSPEVKPVTEVPIGKPIKKTETDLLVRARPNDILNNLNRYSLKELVTLLTQNDREGEYWQYLDTEEFPNKSEALAEARKDVARIFEGFDLFELQQRQSWMDLTQTEEAVSPFAVSEASKKKIGKAKAKELTRQEVELISEEKRMGTKIVPGLKFENIEGQKFEVVDVNRNTGDVTFKNVSDYEGYWRGTNTTNPMKNNYFDYLFYQVSEPLSPEQELKQAFDKWKSETGKLGIVPNWERQIQADIDLFNAAKKYLLLKIEKGAYAFEQFLKDLAIKNVENIEADRSKWKKFYNDTIKEAASAGKREAAAPPPPVTPPAAGRAESEGETKERKTITSIKGLEDISEQVKEALFGETTRYTVLPNQVSLNEANAILSAMGEDKAKALVLNGDENIPDAFRVTLGEVLIKKFNSEGRYDDAVDVATGIANEATGWGQAIQALSLIKFLTPQGQLIAATRTINAIRDKRFKAEEGKMKRVKKAFQKADVEAIEGAIDAVVAQTEETPAPQATRAKTWGEKNKIVTKAVYEAAKKALKKFAFTGVPPELITIAAYHVEAGARSFADFSKEMVKDFGRKVRPYLKAAYKAAQKKVGGTGYSTDKEIAAHLATDLDRDIKDVMKESGVLIRDLIRQHLSEAERTKDAITKALVDKLGLRESDAAVIAAKVEAEYNRLATEKKTKALKAIERRLLRKPPVRKTAEQKLIELSNLGAFKEDKFKEEYARAMGFPEITKENAAKITELAEKVQNAKEGRPKFNAIINLLNYQANLPGVDKMDLATSVWMASLLSGPTTQLKNIFANSYNMGALALNVAAQSPKDIPFLLRGLTIGLGNGLQEGGSTMITGQSPIKQAAAAQGILERTKFSPYNPFGYYKFVPRFMLAADAVTYGGLKEMRAYQLALSEARDKYPTQNAYQKAIEILAQTDAQLQAAQAEAEQEYQEALAEIDADVSLNKVQKEAKKAAAKLDRSRRVYDIVEQNRPNQLVTEAHDFALRGTFNNPPDGALGVAARFFNGITHRVPAVRFFVPFVNVITNVANEYVNYSPLGYARAMKGGSITGNRKTFTEQDRKELMIKATIGTTAAIAAFVLSGIGGDDEEEPFFQITADGYNDYKKNKELELTGWRPYSIKIGNRWASYKLTPMAAMLAAVGALRDRERYGKEKLTENALNKLVIPFQEFMSTTAETSFLGSAETFLSGVLGATKGDKGQKLVEWASKTGGAAVPILGTNLYQQMAERVYDALDVSDKEYRGADGAIGIFAKMLRNVPVIRDEFQNAVNGLGEELPPQTGGVIFSKKETGPHAKLWQLLADKKATTGRPDRRGAAYIDINGDQKAMNDEQFYFFAKTRGEYIRTLMEKQYDRLKEMDEKEFGKWMENARTSANRFANGELTLQAEKGIYEKGIKKYKAEAEHEKDRLMYALERGDVKDAKSAFDNYEPLSTQTKAKDKNAIFVEIVKDDIVPTGIGSLDKIDFYKAVFLNQNPTIRIQEKQSNGKVKLVAKPFNQIFTEEERADYRRMYQEREEDVVKKLSVLDQALQKKYTNMMAGDAIWRKYLKIGASKK